MQVTSISMDSSNYAIVAALDLGFTDSGYAFSFKSEFKIDPLNIYASVDWKAKPRKLLTHKIPTCVLLDKDKELKAFGYDAENEFAEISFCEEQNNYYFFREFYTKKVFPLVRISVH